VELEVPFVFDCQGDPLVGILHGTARPAPRGVLVLVAGGPQYRAGYCRHWVAAARALAAAGIPTMRFDQRGIGDGAGTYQGFRSLEADLAAAIAAFRRQAPEVREVVLWGGCDAASTIMTHAWRLPEVVGCILENPWVHNEATRSRVLITHYYWQRLTEASFWRKVLALRFDPRPALKTVRAALFARPAAPSPAGAVPTPESGAEELPNGARDPSYLDEMREGMRRFRGRVLMIMSGRSLTAKEFDLLISSDRSWKGAMASPASLERHDVRDADQALSTWAARREAIDAARRWLGDWTARD
jgi:exosortase A-associated hydrolase 1